MLLRAGVLQPSALHVTTQPYSSKWNLVTGQNGFAMDRAVRATGWNFMFLAGAQQAFAFGSSEGKNARIAVDRVLAKIEAECFNAAEIAEISTKHMLGIPYSVVRAHARHCQQACTLEANAVRREVQRGIVGRGISEHREK